MRLVASLAATFLLTAQLQAAAQVPPGSAVPGGTWEVALRFQEQRQVRHDIWARFIGYSDDRCPSDRACLVPGHATVILEIHAPPMPSRYVAVESPGPSRGGGQLDQTAFGLRFCFLSLEPLPHSTGLAEPSKLIVRLLVATERTLERCKVGA
jgi:hypothetical protein